ncbi:hypothetical protein DITRI_Ditri14bG0156200 [Diplodiscus trichospermus]
MDLETERSALEFVEDNEATQRFVPHVDDNMIKDNHVDGYNINDNGSFAYHNQTPVLSTDESFDPHALIADNHIKGAIEVAQPMHSPPLPTKSPATTKGYGLKKWRRIKRDFVKDPSATMDSSKILKRGLSASANPTKSQQMTSPKIKQNSECPVGMVNMLNNASVAHGLMMCSPSLDSRFAVEAAFASATDSENSEDRSSKSSTAASVPKVRYDMPLVLGYAHQKNQMKNLSGKTMGNSNQRGQQGKGRPESSKKPRGERVEIEKENSQSSVESDSRSSNFFFVQGQSSVTSNGNQSEKSMDYDGEDSDEAHEEHSDEAHEGEHKIGEEVPTSFRKENSGEIEELLTDNLATDFSWEAKEEKSENDRPSPNEDPLVESIFALQSAHEALENEIQRLAEIGKEPTSLHDDSVNINSVPVDSTLAYQEIHETRSSDQLASTKIRKSSSGSLETQVFTLTHKVKYLESKLEEARAVLQARASRISELEVSVNSSRSGKEELGSTAEMQQDMNREMEFDLEGLFQRKMEAEIEFLSLTGALQKLRVTTVSRITQFEEQTSSAGEHTQMLNRLGEAESKAAMLKEQADLEKHCDVLGTEEVSKMKRRLSPHSGVVAPT